MTSPKKIMCTSLISYIKKKEKKEEEEPNEQNVGDILSHFVCSNGFINEAHRTCRTQTQSCHQIQVPEPEK